MKKLFLYLLIIGPLANTAFGQDGKTEKIEIGTSITIQSKILNESRELLVYSPKNSSGKKIKYPVIYLFDAESLFFTAVGAVKFLNYSSYLPQMPEAYIVGIVNTKRSRDMPVPQEIEKTDGAKNFYSFLSEEVVPYINKNFSTSGLNILAGHSQGALFATYATLENPRLFQFTIALDAPMEVTKSVEQSYSKKLSKNCNTKYVSLKYLYGWNNSFNQDKGCLNYSQITIENESHETMPYKGIYEGLKFLFIDYLPPVKDWSLQSITAYYHSLEKKYQVSYPIPSKVLLESAKQNIAQFKKALAIELINENDKLYAVTQLSQQLLLKANAIVKGPDERVTYSLSQPPPDKEAIKPFLGKWAGVLNVPGGTNLEIEWEILSTNNKYEMISDMMKQFKVKSDFLYISEKKELVWGRKHEGGGIYISIGKLSNDGSTISGTEDLIGFEFPAGMPPFKLNTFEFKKQ